MVDVDNLSAFLSWCDSQQIIRDKVFVGSHSNRGRCLFTAHECVEGDVLVFVPNWAQIVVDTSGSAYHCKHWMMQLVHRILEEDALGSTSVFYPFLSLLLDGSDTPPDVTAWADLLPGAAGRFAQRRATKRSADLKELCDCLPGCAPEHALRALHAVDSHSLWSKKGGLRALVPFFDLMNHDPEPSAHWVMEPPDFHLQVVANRAMGPKEEVTILYDFVSNARLLINYGFVLDCPGPHQDMEFFACVSPPAEIDGECSASAFTAPTTEAEIRIKPDGNVVRRAALVPLLKAAREQVGDSGEDAGEKFLARALASQASAERRLWQELLDQDSAQIDQRLIVLAKSSESTLKQFLDKIEIWLVAPTSQSLIGSLGPPLAVVSSDSDSGSDGRA